MSLQVSLHSLTKRYSDRFTLGPLTLCFEVGITCVVGPNGAGKSTLFDLISGARKPSRGSVKLSTRSGRLGILPQEFYLPPRATPEQFLTYLTWLQGLPPHERRESVARTLEEVGLSQMSSIPIRELSGGTAKRLGIAHALVHDPDIVILDEPTAGLDPIQRVAIRGLISELGARRIVLVSTHLVEDIRGLADRALVLNRGELLFDGDIPTLESLSDLDAPGDTALERALSFLMMSCTQ